jgi:hypothetical protein
MDLDEILDEGDGIEYYRYYISFNPVDSIIPKWRTIKLLCWVEDLSWLVDLDEILYGGDGIQDDLYSILLNPVALFQNGRRLNFWDGWKEPSYNVWSDW